MSINGPSNKESRTSEQDLLLCKKIIEFFTVINTHTCETFFQYDFALQEESNVVTYRSKDANIFTTICYQHSHYKNLHFFS